jgi:hypothetical protein
MHLNGIFCEEFRGFRQTLKGVRGTSEVQNPCPYAVSTDVVTASQSMFNLFETPVQAS